MNTLFTNLVVLLLCAYRVAVPYSLAAFVIGDVEHANAVEHVKRGGVSHDFVGIIAVQTVLVPVGLVYPQQKVALEAVYVQAVGESVFLKKARLLWMRSRVRIFLLCRECSP